MDKFLVEATVNDDHAIFGVFDYDPTNELVDLEKTLKDTYPGDKVEVWASTWPANTLLEPADVFDPLNEVEEGE